MISPANWTTPLLREILPSSAEHAVASDHGRFDRLTVLEADDQGDDGGQGKITGVHLITGFEQHLALLDVQQFQVRTQEGQIPRG
jgi:hypothetical protein